MPVCEGTRLDNKGACAHGICICINACVCEVSYKQVPKFIYSIEYLKKMEVESEAEKELRTL